MADEITVNEDSSVTVGLLANDTDPDGDALTIYSVTQPANGTLINNSTTITYTPAADFFGSDGFTYTLIDGHGGSDLAAVTITVNNVPDAPAARADGANTDENTAVTIDVLANDSDADGDTLAIDSVTQPANGLVVNNGTVITYTPDIGFVGSDVFTYTVSDTLPLAVEFEAVSSSQGVCTEEDGDIACELGEIAAGSEATIALIVMPEEPGEGITNTAIVAGNEPDPDLTNNEDTAVITVVEITICQGVPATIVGTARGGTHSVPRPEYPTKRS